MRSAPPLLLLLLVPTLGSRASAQQPDEGLRLDTLLAIARERSPRLEALAAAAEAAAHREPEVSALPDPMLELGIMNFGVPDLNTDMAMSMAPALQLTQRFPFPGKLSLRGDIASLSTEMASVAADEGWWEVRAQVASLFYDLYALDRRLDVMRETLGLLQDFREVAKAMYASGTGRQADVLRADVEVARMDGDVQQMEARRTVTVARLNAALDRPADTEVPTPVVDDLPLTLPPADSLAVRAQEGRPLLVRARLGVERSRSQSALASREIWPDVTLALSYGQRDRGLGTERMASAMIGFTVPVHAGSRQLALREEAGAVERLAAAELSGREAEVAARIAELLADLRRASSLAVLYRDEVIPEARATVESAFSSYRVGSVDFMTLVDAQMAVNRYEGELYVLLSDYGRSIAALESAVGGALPRTGPLLTEGR